MIETIKKNGKLNINELSKKQVIALLNLWDTDYVKNENTSFSQMLTRCYKSTPWHENAPIIYIHADDKTVTTIKHAFYDLTEGEEEIILNAIK